MHDHATEPVPTHRSPEPDRLDDLLAELHRDGPSLRNGFTSHAPMVLETLLALGAHEQALSYARDHRAHATARPPELAPIDAMQWEDALGDAHRFADWARFFRAELRARGVAGALDLHCGRLASGFVASATHGVIRTAHGARAFAENPSPVRLAEIAEGLALWASEHQTLPGDARTTDTAAPPTADEITAALARVPRVPVARRRPKGTIVAALATLDATPGFAAAATLDPGRDPVAAALAASEAFARTLLEQARDPLTAIVFTHAVTSTAAVLDLAPFVRVETTRKLVAHAFRTGAALLAVYGGDEARVVAHETEPLDVSITAALANGDDHVIKLSAACARLHARSGAGVFLAVPRHARGLLSRGDEA